MFRKSKNLISGGAELSRTRLTGQALYRLGAGLLLLFGVLFLPWWVFFVTGWILFFVFDNYVEWLAAALLFDLLYGSPVVRWNGFQFVLSFFALVLFFALMPFKERMRF